MAEREDEEKVEKSNEPLYYNERDLAVAKLLQERRDEWKGRRRRDQHALTTAEHDILQRMWSAIVRDTLKAKELHADAETLGVIYDTLREYDETVESIQNMRRTLTPVADEIMRSRLEEYRRAAREVREKLIPESIPRIR